MALSNPSIFTRDTYSSSPTNEGDALSRAVERTDLSPGDLSSASSSGGSSTSGISNAQAKGAIKGAIVATKFMMDLNNARSAYQATNAALTNNLMLSRLNEADTIQRGRQSVLERRVEGEIASDQALMHLAAQGVDVNSPGAQNIIKSYEAMGIYNAMREEANMFREAFKFDIEQAELEYASDMAKINYDQAKFNATMDFAFGTLDAVATGGTFA